MLSLHFLFLPLLLSPSVLVSLSPENPAIVCPIQVFTAFVSLTTADPEWEPIVCEQPLTCQSLGPALHHPQGSLKESLEKSKATSGHLKSEWLWLCEPHASHPAVLSRPRNHHLHLM